MIEPIYILAFILSLFLFWKLEKARAAFIVLTGGWLLLPIRSFSLDMKGEVFLSKILPTAIPGPIFLNKAVVTGMILFLCILFFDRETLRQWRPKLWDTVMLCFCLTPFALVIQAKLPVYTGLSQSLYLFFSWGTPYLVGRFYLVSKERFLSFAHIILLYGLLLLPFCFSEFLYEPWVYKLLYGFHPYQTEGIERYFLHRPLLFFEDGNQFGMWMTSISFLSWGMWKENELRKILFIPPFLIVTNIIVMTFLCQSLSALIWLVLAMMLLRVLKRQPKKIVFGLLIALSLLLGLRLTQAIPLKKIAYETPIGEKIRYAFQSIDKSSLTWRLKHEEISINTAKENPFLGTGAPYWYLKNDNIRPWSLWVLYFGMYGLLGLFLLATVLLGPSIRYLLGKRIETAVVLPLSMMLLCNIADLLLNSTLILAFLAINGGLLTSQISCEED
jgi:hypothetical protein